MTIRVRHKSVMDQKTVMSFFFLSFFFFATGIPGRVTIRRIIYLVENARQHSKSVTRNRKESPRLSCESAAEKIPIATRQNPTSWKDFRGKRPLANVRLRGPACTRF
ncbi:hypothetical protein PUN28_000689 [Cardiocondyla obscurior]|uniref:Secreted protein n=1 Tax=Cardiocondyla obscurior TaxID=286306 RepID=A0AAW2H0Z3_9HYME